MRPPKPTLLNRLNNIDCDTSNMHRRIAEFLKSNMHEAALWGIEDLARETNASVATLVRFAKKLGYSGYLEMRKAMVQSVQRHYQRGSQLLEAPAHAAETLVEVSRRDIHNIELLMQEVDEAMLQRACDMLKKSRFRLAIGDGVSALMSRQLAYLLINIGMPTMEGNPADFACQVATLTPKDLLIAISLTPYTKETLDSVAYARSRKVPIMAFTDGLFSPLAKIANLTLPIPGKNLLFSHSLTTFGVLAHALVTSIAREDPQKILRELREVENVARSKFV